MLGRTAIAVIVALALVAPVYAGDIVAMPTGNSVRPGDLELNAIWWEQPNNMAGRIVIGEAFIGVVKGIEIDVLYADVEQVPPGADDSYFEVNAYATVLAETPTRPSLIVGVTNVSGEDWLGGMQFGGNPDFDDPSLFVLGSYNLAVPQTGITWQTPLIRAHLGWGNNWHEEVAFGGVQFKIHPQFGGAVLNYKSMPAYMATWAPKEKCEVTVGFLGGDVFYRAGAFLDW